MSSDGMRPPDAPRSTTERAADGTVISRPDEADEFMTDENVYILEVWRSPADPALSIARAIDHRQAQDRGRQVGRAQVEALDQDLFIVV